MLARHRFACRHNLEYGVDKLSSLNADLQGVLPLMPEASARETALAKIDAVNLAQYARTRNVLDGRKL